MSPDLPGTPPSEPVRGAGDGEPDAEQPRTGWSLPGELHSSEQPERFGPLQLTRIRKDDGRELIFFADPRGPV
jgi:hypothetical protein